MTYILRYREEWPLWSVEKRIYGEQVWVELDDVPDLTTKRDGLHRLAEELRRLERTLLHDGIYGWIASVALENAKMNRLLQLIGARHYHTDGAYHYYQKFAGVPEIPADAMAVFRQHREVAHA
jgi:hypothetical protein